MIKKGNCKLNVFGIKQVFGGIIGRLFSLIKCEQRKQNNLEK